MNRTRLLPTLAAGALLLMTPAHAASKKHLDMPGRGDALPFSHGVLAGNTLYLSGGLGLDPETGLAPEDVEKEIRLLMEGMKGKLKLAGMGMDDLVSVQIFCTDLSLYETFNAIYATYFEGDPPARAFIGAGSLLRRARFEIIGIAVRD